MAWFPKCIRLVVVRSVNTEDSLGLYLVEHTANWGGGGCRLKAEHFLKQMRFRGLVHTISFQVPGGPQNSCTNLPFFVPRDMEIIFGQFDSLKK